VVFLYRDQEQTLRKVQKTDEGTKAKSVSEDSVRKLLSKG